MQNYLKVHYSEDTKPITDYPEKLCNYLACRYNVALGSVIVDAGCGRGELLDAFSRYGLKAHGLDIMEFPEGIIGNHPVRAVNFENGRFPFEDNTADVVFSKSVIEHLHNPENFLRESCRVLKPGGRIIVMTPDWQSHRYVFYGDHTHVQPYVEAGLASALRMFGFGDVSTELFYQLPWAWSRPLLKALLKPLRVVFPIKKSGGNSFWRWSRELMILGTGVKQA